MPGNTETAACPALLGYVQRIQKLQLSLANPAQHDTAELNAYQSSSVSKVTLQQISRWYSTRHNTA